MSHALRPPHTGIDAVLRPRGFDHPDSARLLREYAAERRETVGFDDPPGLDTPSQYEPPCGVFLVAYTQTGKPVACGGIRAYSETDRVAEIRKMFVVPEHRKRGLARRVLIGLELFAVAHGTHRVLLETGSYNHAATHLYASVGYEPIAPYVPGRPDFNRAFSKSLI